MTRASTMSSSPSPSPNAPGSPDSQISPRTVVPPFQSAAHAAGSYFSPPDAPRLESISEHVQPDDGHSRNASVGSVTFKGSSHIVLEGPPRRKSKGKSRARAISPPKPPIIRFQRHVSFDNFAAAKPTEKNFPSLTLYAKHKGYAFKRQSRTFMVGVDENEYSDIALQWLLDEMVDEGDEVICVRVIEEDSKKLNYRNLEEKQYQKEAQTLLDKIQSKNHVDRAISITLELAVGNLYKTFQRLIEFHQPAMIVVGTQGKGLGVLQTLITNRASFSNWCLQEAPIPTIVVRPTTMRMKKKKERDADPSRRAYVNILKDSGIEEHETDVNAKHEVFEASVNQDAEARAVVNALGLPGTFDPTVKPINLEQVLKYQKKAPRNEETKASANNLSPEFRPTSPGKAMQSSKSGQLENVGVSEGESSEGDEDEEEGGFDVVPGQHLLANSKEGSETAKMKLHQMEMDEAAALARSRADPGEGSSRRPRLSDVVPDGGPSDEEEEEEDEEAYKSRLEEKKHEMETAEAATLAARRREDKGKGIGCGSELPPIIDDEDEVKEEGETATAK